MRELTTALKNDIRELPLTFLHHDPAARSAVEVLLLYPGVKALLLHRVAHSLWSHQFFFAARALSEFARFLSGIEIHPGAQIGRRLVIDHGMGVVIGETAVVEDDVCLYQGVTLGGTSLAKAKRHPTIRSGALVGMGACVLGNIVVGRNAKVGAGAVVLSDVPDGASVGGVPATLLGHRATNEGNLNETEGNLNERKQKMHGNIYDNIAQTIGNTPLVRLNKVTKDCFAEVVVKLECFNPLSSVKDRMALSMIEDAEKSGKLKPGMRLIEPTSGNTGIGLAFVAAAKGYKLTIVMPETMSMERRLLLKIFGAELILTPGPKGMKGAVALATQLAESDTSALMLQQFSNPANPQIHVETTAEEIWRDTHGKVDIVVAGVGTGGTVTGVGRGLKAKNPSLKMVAVEPTESAVLLGGAPGPHKIQGIGAGFVPAVLDTHIYEEIIQVASEEAFAWTLRLIQEEGIPAGISSGAVTKAAIDLAKRPENKGKRIVAILASGTERYLSTPLTEQLRAEVAKIQVTDVQI